MSFTSDSWKKSGGLNRTSSNNTVRTPNAINTLLAVTNEIGNDPLSSISTVFNSNVIINGYIQTNNPTVSYPPVSNIYTAINYPKNISYKNFDASSARVTITLSSQTSLSDYFIANTGYSTVFDINAIECEWNQTPQVATARAITHIYWSRFSDQISPQTTGNWGNSNYKLNNNITSGITGRPYYSQNYSFDASNNGVNCTEWIGNIEGNIISDTEYNFVIDFPHTIAPSGSAKKNIDMTVLSSIPNTAISDNIQTVVDISAS